MKPVNVSYQGVSGAFSEKAIRESLGPSPYVTATGYPTFEKTFEAVQIGEMDFAVLPIENSLGGSIHANYDLLLKYDLVIVGEYDLRVEHCLLAMPGVTKEHIKSVISHPQALAQCAHYISTLNDDVVPCAEYDTAGSAKKVAQHRMMDTAAIASDLAAETYGLTVLERNIEDDAGNFTRFLLLTKQMTPNQRAIREAEVPETEFKTSLVFSFADDNKQGQLYKVLSAFSLREIDLCKIESRPWGYTATQRLLASNGANLDAPDRRKYKYLFYTDVIGHEQDENIVNALRHVREICHFVRVLGSYPTHGGLSSCVRQQLLAAGCSINDHGNALTRANSSGPLRKLRIGVYGFGNFGQFLTKTLAKYHHIQVTSRGDYSAQARDMGAIFYPCSNQSEIERFLKGIDILILSVSILSFESVLHSISPSLLEDIVLVDVLSVKTHPKRIMMEHAPSSCSILCTHPMFGPESGKYSWRSLPMMFDKVRVVSPEHDAAISSFLRVFETEMCRMLEMTCELHDEIAASTQFLTHLTGRILGVQGLGHTCLDTRGYKSLVRLVDDTCKDSLDLFRGLYMFNPNSERQIQQFKHSLEDIEKLLRGPAKMSKESSSSTRFYGPTNPLLNKVKAAQTVVIHGITKQLEAEGKTVYSLCVGEPDFLPDARVLAAGAKAFQDGKMKYPALTGVLELRKLIAKYLKLSKGVKYNPESQILISNGAKQSVFQSLFCMCKPGDQVLIPAPYWVSYPEMVKLVQAEPIILETTIENNYLIDPEALEEKLTLNPRIRILILCNPSNPAGTLHEPHHISAIANVLHKPQFQHVVVISDEIYEQLVYQDATENVLRLHQCFASLPGMYERTIVINGFSKSHAMPGLRLGYMAASKSIVQACAKVQGQLTSGASSVGQLAACEAMHLELEAVQDPASVPRITSTLSLMDEKRSFVIKCLNELPHIRFVHPTAAFYVFLDFSWYFDGKYASVRASPSTLIESCDDFCKYLLQEYHTAVVPGSAFGILHGIRISYATSLEILGKALSSLKSALESLQVADSN
ncbi:hypothetical protein ABG067_004177 [Albugo candida]